MRRLHFCSVAVALLATAAACSNEKPSQRIPAYLSSDDCSQHTDETVCAADTTNGCQWFALGVACPEGVDCPSGVCQAPDPCAGHDDAAACAADTANTCAWAEIDLLCPPGADCPAGDGFCYTQAGGDDCACVCPVYCPAGAECPPCECDCPGGGDGGSGGTCTCEAAPCAAGEVCPPGDCTCEPDTGCTDGGTCTCACPACEPGQECPPCDCACEGEPSVPDPCLAITDEAACAADTADSCSWIAVGAPCMDGQTCVSGVCQNLGLVGGGSGGSGGDCVCACPECPAGTECPPCECDCTGGTGCITPDQPPPTLPPMP